MIARRVIHVLVSDSELVDRENQVYRTPWEKFQFGINLKLGVRLRIYVKLWRVCWYISIPSPDYWWKGEEGCTVIQHCFWWRNKYQMNYWPATMRVQ